MTRELEMNELISVVKNYNRLDHKQTLLESSVHPLAGNPYHHKSNVELQFIVKDAGEAARAMQGHNATAEKKYLDQVNDATTVLAWRKEHGMPDWYKEKYNLKENREMQIIMFNNRPVDINSIEVGGIDTRDHPDYADAFFEYAEYHDGTPLSDDELDELRNENPELLYDMINASLFEKRNLEEIGPVGKALGAAGMAAAALAGTAAPTAAQTPGVRHDIMRHYDQATVQKSMAADIAAAAKALPAAQQQLNDMLAKFKELTPQQQQLVANLQTGMKLPTDAANMPNWIKFTNRNIDLASQM